MITAEHNIADIERHCNNFFNPQNDRTAPRDHPPEFLALAGRILAFRNSEEGQPTALAGETVANVYSWKAATVDGLAADWTQVFKRELSVYRRIKFL